MTKQVSPPAQNPCGSCPYRRDVASGVWAREEYERLPEYDAPTWKQPPQCFMCHQNDDRLCAGWVAVHDMEESLGVRFALSMNLIRSEDADGIFDYTTSTPLFASGQEACDHGMREMEEPSRKAVNTITNLLVKRRIRGKK